MRKWLPTAFRALRRSRLGITQAVVALLGFFFAASVFAHAASTAYLDLGTPQANEVSLQWVVALRDLDAVLDLDANGDGQLAWSEVTSRGC